MKTIGMLMEQFFTLEETDCCWIQLQDETGETWEISHCLTQHHTAYFVLRENNLFSGQSIFNTHHFYDWVQQESEDPYWESEDEAGQSLDANTQVWNAPCYIEFKEERHPIEEVLKTPQGWILTFKLKNTSL